MNNKEEKIKKELEINQKFEKRTNEILKSLLLKSIENIKENRKKE